MGRMFEKRKHKMFKRYDRMAKAFTRVGKEIAIAVKAGGPEPDHNPALRRAMQNARSVNMPKDRVEAAIKRASGNDVEDYQELVYEGYGPHGVAILIETATDNPTRTVANLRNIFKKGNGNLGNSGSVSFMFEHHGVFKLDPEGIDRDELLLEMIDHGLEALEDDEDDDGNPLLVLRCAFNDFGDLQSALEERDLEPKASGGEYLPTTTTDLDDEASDEVLELVETLESDDDVQNVFHTLA